MATLSSRYLFGLGLGLPRLAPALGAIAGAGFRTVPLGAGAVGKFLEDVWGSILRAVPKKKTSYSKKRSRFLAGKGLKDETAFSKCPTCGQPIRLHILCPYCVEMIRLFWKDGLKKLKL